MRRGHKPIESASSPGVGPNAGLGPDVSTRAPYLQVALAGIPMAGATELLGPLLASTWLTAAAHVEGDQLDDGQRQDMATGSLMLRDGPG